MTVFPADMRVGIPSASGRDILCVSPVSLLCTSERFRSNGLIWVVLHRLPGGSVVAEEVAR
jgi:hypothetical protein